MSTETTIHLRPGLHRGQLGCALPTSGAACYVNDSVAEPSGAGLRSHPQPQGRYFLLSSLTGGARAWSFIHSLICPLIPSLSAGDAPGALGAWQVAAEEALGKRLSRAEGWMETARSVVGGAAGRAHFQAPHCCPQTRWSAVIFLSSAPPSMVLEPAST